MYTGATPFRFASSIGLAGEILGSDGDGTTLWKKTHSTISTDQVSQITSSTTAVTLDSQSGTIITYAAVYGPGTTHTFTVINNKVLSTADLVKVSVANSTQATDGTDGYFVASCAKTNIGSFDITLRNWHTLNSSTAASVAISFEVMNAV